MKASCLLATVGALALVAATIGAFLKAVGEGFPFGGRVTGLDPAKTLAEKTGLKLPKSAERVEFDYESSIDDYFTLRFRVPKAAALAFAAQKPFERWESHPEDDSNPISFWKTGPRAPFREAEVALPNARYLHAFIEERGGSLWTVWVSWNET